ncbi:MAG TPA: RNA polymerase factor sigma-32 [Candidatus Binatia bacterium]|jgi:RNA polymerase sigma-32 factor|nr:RNA polymerase factor sigma-32 [Candidatus Binatia bacterium]
MAEDDKNTELDFPYSEVDLRKIAETSEGGARDKALVPFDPLQRYLTEIRRFPLLGRDEEHRLAVQYKEYGDVKAAYKLVTSNLRLVVMIAREYQKAFKNLLDLIQEGNMGLMEAVKNFDPYRGVRFPSYAVWWIRAYMIRYIMNDWRMVKIGTTQAQRKLFFNLQKEKEKIEAEGLTPGPKLLAQRLHVKEDEVVEMEQRLGSRDLSVDVPIGDDDEATLLNFLQDNKQSPEEQFADAQYRELLRLKMEQFAKNLKDKELVIYRERLLTEDPVTLREIGEKYGISRERVRQIEERVKKKLKAYLNKELKDVTDFAGPA